VVSIWSVPLSTYCIDPKRIVDGPPVSAFEALGAEAEVKMHTGTGEIGSISSSSGDASSDLDVVSTLHGNPIFLPDPISTAQSILSYLAALAVLHLVLHVAVAGVGKNKNRPKTSGGGGGAGGARTQLQNSYKVTSLVMNGLLAGLGTYHFYFTLPNTTAASERIAGYEELGMLSAIIIAYNLWALPVGLAIKEPSEMIFHHVAVLLVASLPAFFTNGFRYFTPFFFGLIEISSVPLVMMNAFRENPHLDREYPITSLIAGGSFAVSFIVTRVIMWMPQSYDFCRLAFLLCYTSESFGGRAILGAGILANFFLTALQLFWARKIINGVMDVLLLSKKVKETS